MRWQPTPGRQIFYAWAIPVLSGILPVIARSETTKQSSASLVALDCFANARNDVLLRSHLRLAVGDAIDGAVPVVGDQERTVLHLHHIDRPADIFVVLQETGDQRLHRPHGAVLVQMDDDHVAAGLV